MLRTFKTQTGRGQVKHRSTDRRITSTARFAARQSQVAGPSRLTLSVAENAPRDTIRSGQNDADSAARKPRRRSHL